MNLPDKAPHPAKFNRDILDRIVHAIQWHTVTPEDALVFDPFGGTGKVFEILDIFPNYHITALEIEPRWASWDPRITLGDALNNGFPDEHFDLVVTSPTFGNRMADHHNAKDGSKRNTYRHQYGEDLQPNNSGTLQWGDKYRDFHNAAWKETVRTMVPGGFFILDIKDHIRKGKVQRVSDWHVHALISAGISYVDTLRVNVKGNRQGQNGDVRVDHSDIIVFEKTKG